MTAAEKKKELAEQGNQQAALVVNNALIDGMVKQLRDKEKFGLTFPADYNVANAMNGAYLVLQETKDKNGKPVLESCTGASITHTLMDMATMGLSMQKKQCYPVAYGGKLQCQVSYHGHKAMAHRYGAKTIDAEVIYEGDDFAYHIENGRKVWDKHIQDFHNVDLDKVIGAYCVINLCDGSTYLEVMNIKQIKTAWKKGYGYKEGSGTHKEFTDMMAKKTVTSRACKQIVQQYGDVFTIEAFEEAEEVEIVDKVAADVEYETSTEANSVDFDEEADFTEVEEAVSNKEEQEVVSEQADGETPDCFK